MRHSVEALMNRQLSQKVRFARGNGRQALAFLRNHREAIAAMDFFTVPTLTFCVLYCFFVIGHDRRRVLHFNVTRHPSSGWIVQQLREAFPEQAAPRFLIFDGDAKYGFGGSNRSTVDGYPSGSDLVPKSLAKWGCGAVD